MSQRQFRSRPWLYEINTALWLSELARATGKSVDLSGVPAEAWDEMRSLGFDFIWLMGVWKRSRAGLVAYRRDPAFCSILAEMESYSPGFREEDLIGSPYSISSYEPAKMFGGWAGIDAARHEINKRGMGLILDFIPNHTGPDHPWVLNHPEFYITGNSDQFRQSPSYFHQINGARGMIYVAKGGDPYFPPWTDTGQLNYFSPDMRAALLSELREISSHCDGLRCDMAMLVLNDVYQRNWGWLKRDGDPPEEEFWTEARKTVPDLLLIAEAYWDTEWRLRELGFDFVYDKKFYDRVRHGTAADIVAHLKADISFQEGLVRFLENHDEERSAAAFAGARYEAAAVLFLTLPGMKLFYQGQLQGHKKRMPLFLQNAVTEESDESIRQFYTRIISIMKQPVFSEGRWRFLDIESAGDETYRNIIAYSWADKGSLKLVAVNMSEEYAQGRISLNGLIGRSNYRLFDELGMQEYMRSGEEMMRPGLHVVLRGYQAQLFDISGRF